MTRDELIEVMARAIWDERCRHWGKYRKHLNEPNSEGYDWDDLGLSKHKELLREAATTLAAIEAAGMRVVPAVFQNPTFDPNLSNRATPPAQEDGQ